MKYTKLLLAGSLALIAASMASAQTVIKVTGSTAFRRAFYHAVVNTLDNPKGVAIGGSTSDMTGANRARITGTIKTGLPNAGAAVEIQTCFSGSVGGVQAVSQNYYPNVLFPVATRPQSGTTVGVAWDTEKAWLSSAVGGSNLSISGNAIANASILAEGAASFNPGALADVTMSDSIQGSTNYPSPALTETKVGVIAFQFVKGLADTDTAQLGTLSRITNISSLQARGLLTNGYLPGNMMTGSSADSGVDVVIVGRDIDSGTRLASYAESAFGVGSTGVINNLGLSGTAGNAANPGSRINAINPGYDNDGTGYNGGGALAAAVGTKIQNGLLSPYGAGTNKAVVLGYAGTSDADTVVTNGGAKLTYNGVAYSVAAVQQGAYTFWTYQWLDYRGSYAGTGKSYADSVALQLKNTDAAKSGILLSTMLVERGAEGSVVSTL
jgi:hypothetical protein